MSGRVLPFPRSPRRLRRIVIERIGLPPAERWLVACDCGAQKRLGSREEARAFRRSHQADHARAEAAHPAGKARPEGDRS